MLCNVCHLVIAIYVHVESNWENQRTKYFSAERPSSNVRQDAFAVGRCSEKAVED